MRTAGAKAGVELVTAFRFHQFHSPVFSAGDCLACAVLVPWQTVGAAGGKRRLQRETCGGLC